MSDPVIALISGALGALVGVVSVGLKDVLVARFSRRKNAEFLAIRIVVSMDLFVEGCTQVVGDDGLFHGQPAEDGCSYIQHSVPEFKIHTMDGDWKALPTKLMYGILSFPNLVNSADHLISGRFDNDAPPDYSEGFEERQFQYAVLGLKASAFADELRKTYKIPAREYGDWHPVKYLSISLDELVREREKRQVAHASMLEQLNQSSGIFSSPITSNDAQ